MNTPDSQQAQYPLLRQAGDSAVLIEFGATLDLVINAAAQAFDARLRDSQIDGIAEITPTLRSVLVRYNPLVIDSAKLHRELTALLDDSDWLHAPAVTDRRHWVIPVAYGEHYGPDLEDVARLLGVDVDEVARQHCAQKLRVLTLGFSPGFTYLGLMPEAWDLPRLNYVKPAVPAGAISVAVRQTVMTSTPIPTGWRTIGQTPFSNFNLNIDPPFLIGSGDELSFRSIDHREFLSLKEQVEAGESILQPAGEA
jgi:KipI family sensor histidine kinase inhibitor